MTHGAVVRSSISYWFGSFLPLDMLGIYDSLSNNSDSKQDLWIQRQLTITLNHYYNFSPLLLSLVMDK